MHVNAVINGKKVPIKRQYYESIESLSASGRLRRCSSAQWVPCQIHNHYEIEPCIKLGKSEDKLSERVKRKRFVVPKRTCCMEEAVAEIVIDPLV
jgi:hypothetical protein